MTSRNHEFGDGPFESILPATDSISIFRETGAQYFIDEIAVESNGRLDISATSAKIGIPVYYEMPDGLDPGPVEGRFYGLNDGYPLMIYLNPKYMNQDHATTFGHELGHYFVWSAGYRRSGRIPNGNVEENFCNFFGRQMALPIEKLLPVAAPPQAETVAELMHNYGVSHSDVLLQLMLAGKIPRRIHFDTGNGLQTNELYSNKVHRFTECLDCDTGNPHNTSYNPTDPVYDFTRYDWAPRTGSLSCKDQSESNTFRTLNQAYGRWREIDDMLLEKQRVRRREADEETSSKKDWWDYRVSLFDEDDPF